jgi:allantoate deiminase
MAAAPQSPHIDDLGARAETMIMTLGAISAEPSRLIRRFLTPEHRRAADLVARWMRDAGLAVDEDALGTVRGRLAGAGARRLLIGSHIDTVVDAGKYDGPFGVIAGILAAAHFARAKGGLPFGLDVLAFGDEEGSRFPATLASSAAVAGVFDQARLEQADPDGITLAQAIVGFGKNPQDISEAAYPRGDAAAYIEVHIEQGPVLEARNMPLGVVTAIVGQTYFSVELSGEAGHAGTVPMTLRRDALAGAAEIVRLAEAFGREHRDVVATVGHLSVQPNATNVIPSHVELTLDLRSTSDESRRALAERFRSEVRSIADRRQLGLTITQTRNTNTTACDPRLQDQLAAAIATVAGGEALRLGSGAGHDGQAMARLCPVAMLFVRCRGGVSHNPMEYASPRDMGLAVAALIEFIAKFDPSNVG